MSTRFISLIKERHNLLLSMVYGISTENYYLQRVYVAKTGEQEAQNITNNQKHIYYEFFCLLLSAYESRSTPFRNMKGIAHHYRRITPNGFGLDGFPERINYQLLDKWYNVLYTFYGLNQKSTVEDVDNVPRILNKMLSALSSSYLYEFDAQIQENHSRSSKQTRDYGNGDIHDNVIDENVKNFCLQRNIFTEDEYKEYRFSPNIFDKLFNDRIKDPRSLAIHLYELIDFFSEISFLSTLGIYLKDSLTRYSSVKKYFTYLGRNPSNPSDRDPEDKNRFYGNRLIYSQTPDKTIIVKEIDYEIALSFEAVFRCLKAIYDEKYISYNGKCYIPVCIVYKDMPFDNGLQYPFLIACDNEIYCELPLFGNISVSVDVKYDKNITIQENIIDQMNEFLEIKVEFYVKSDKPYLIKQIDMAKSYIIHGEDSPEEIDFVSPYYKDIFKVKKKTRIFRINKTDYSSFVLWIREFGEFAKIIDNQYSCEQEKIVDFNLQLVDPEENIDNILFNPYNSFVFHEKLYPYLNDEYLKCYGEHLKLHNTDSINGYSIEDIFKEKLPPPTNLEIFWLDFILKNYANMSKLFLDDSEYEYISAHVKEYCDLQKRMFNPFKVAEDSYKRLKIEKDSYPMYSPYLNILQDINKDSVNLIKRFFQYSKNDLKLLLYKKDIPDGSIDALNMIYSWEYDIRRKQFVSPMLYELHRNAIVKASKDFANDDVKELSIDETDAKDGQYHLTYFIFSALVKMIFATIDRWLYRFIDKFDYELLEIITNNEDESGNLEYSSLIIDKCLEELLGNGIFKLRRRENSVIEWLRAEFPNMRKLNMYPLMYNRLIRSRNVSKEKKLFIQNVFKYYNKEICKNYNERLETEGLPPFGQNELAYKTCVLFMFYVQEFSPEKATINKNIQRVIENMASELISGLIKKEAAFYATYLKQCALKLRLKPGLFNKNESLNHLDAVYSAFYDYNCYHKIVKDENNEPTLEFIILYERFNFRKIHRKIMRLSRIVDVIEPDSTKTFIDKRLEIMKNSNDV